MKENKRDALFPFLILICLLCQPQPISCYLSFLLSLYIYTYVYFRSKMKVIIFLLLLFSITNLFNSTVSSCSCSKKHLSLLKEFKQTDYIFIGTVKNTSITWRNNDTEASRDIQLQIDKLFKKPSSFNHSSLITIYTSKDRSGCGIKMKINQRWQIWATYTNMFSNDDNPRWLTVDSCGRTTKIYNRNLSRLRRLSSRS